MPYFENEGEGKEWLEFNTAIKNLNEYRNIQLLKERRKRKEAEMEIKLLKKKIYRLEGVILSFIDNPDDW